MSNVVQLIHCRNPTDLSKVTARALKRLKITDDRDKKLPYSPVACYVRPDEVSQQLGAFLIKARVAGVADLGDTDGRNPSETGGAIIDAMEGLSLLAKCK